MVNNFKEESSSSPTSVARDFIGLLRCHSQALSQEFYQIRIHIVVHFGRTGC